MPSTGTSQFNVNSVTMMTQVAQVLRVLLPGGVLSNDQITQMRVELNMMLKFWATKGLKLWTYQIVQIPMVANKGTYTIGPVGADVTAVRPLRVFPTGNFLRQLNGGTPYDMPLRLISRAEYDEYGAKASTGVPNSIYYQPGIDLAAGATSPSSGFGTLYTYVTPASNALPRTMFLNAQRPIYDMTIDTDEFDLPSEWFEAIKFGLAYRMADYFEVAEERIMRLKKRSEETLEMCADWSTEEAPMQIVPDYSVTQSRYR